MAIEQLGERVPVSPMREKLARRAEPKGWTS